MTTINIEHFIAGEPAVRITRVQPDLWHALDDGRIAGRGGTSTRPDGRLFLYIDAWHRCVFDRLAAAMLAELPQQLHTVIDDAEHDLLAGWQRAGLTVRRRQWLYVVPTDPPTTGPARPPAGVSILPAGTAEAGPLRDLDRAVRAEVDATVGWAELPVEVPPRPAGDPVGDPADYAVAVARGEYVGLIRTQATRVPRLARIGLLAVRGEWQRRGVARALLAHTLDVLRQAGIERAAAEVSEANEAATALITRIGAHRTSSTLELMRHGR